MCYFTSNAISNVPELMSDDFFIRDPGTELLGCFTSGFRLENEENTADKSQCIEAIQSEETSHLDHLNLNDRYDGDRHDLGHVLDHDDGRYAPRPTLIIERRSSKDETFTETVEDVSMQIIIQSRNLRKKV